MHSIPDEHSLDRVHNPPIVPIMADRLEDLLAEILALPEEDRRYLTQLLSTQESVRAVREAVPSYVDIESESLNRMKSVLVKLPDDLVTEAQAAGLLGQKNLEQLIRRALREQVERVHASDGRAGPRSSRLPVYEGKSGLAKGIDPSSNRSMLDAAGDDT